MEVSGQLYALVTLLLMNDFPVLVDWEAGWAPDLEDRGKNTCLLSSSSSFIKIDIMRPLLDILCHEKNIFYSFHTS
jgi:hypothetical protein